MEIEALLLETISSMVLDLFTIDELEEKGIKESVFNWKFNSKNINLIPVLELYDDKGKIYKIIEATEFSRMLQDLLKETQLLYDLNDKTSFSKNDKIKTDILKRLENKEFEDECDECEYKNDCLLSLFKD